MSTYLASLASFSGSGFRLCRSCQRLMADITIAKYAVTTKLFMIYSEIRILCGKVNMGRIDHT